MHTRLIAVALTAAFLAGCASQASQNYLAATQAQCVAGSRDACSRVGAAQAAVALEQAQNGQAVALGLLGVLGAAATGLDAYAASRGRW